MSSAARWSLKNAVILGAICGGLFELITGSFASLLGFLKVFLFGAIGGACVFAAVWLAGALVVIALARKGDSEK